MFYTFHFNKSRHYEENKIVKVNWYVHKVHNCVAINNEYGWEKI